ncbi:SUMF1/EgtB/PvdO family nonheme iron enzyme [Candidatus Parabeggiatoa sp. HSG14]|uniref:SUMF1/EgtB/PvdO family nonheme iron enzyme n=1 Tax=Candidatus Parabeggiatoa sp. HSG14 TaxID=3055593 RepID=UPI0025A7FEEB|nr:SUMF1/EgtB/PvdO family nonheme iron enzyme [Thiotrichales bacterium HSG14]
MSLKKVIKTSLSALLDSPIVSILADMVGGNQAVSILKEYFTFTPNEIAKAFQTSYGYALGAISAGLTTPEQKLAFLKKLTHSKLTRGFSDQIEQHYLQSFASESGVQSETLSALRKQLFENIQQLSKAPPIFEAEETVLSDTELADIINHKGTLAITDLVLAHLRDVAPLDETLENFLRHKELLGNAILFFFRQLLRKDSRAEKTFTALQQAGLWTDVRDIKLAQTQLLTLFQQQLDVQNANAMQALQSGDFIKANQLTQQLQQLQKTVDDVPQYLQQAQTAWQQNQQQLVQFSQRFENWAGLLDEKVEEVLETISGLPTQIEGGFKKLSKEVNELKQLMTDFMGRFDLSAHVKADDEFTYYNQHSLELVQKTVARVKELQDFQNLDGFSVPAYQLTNMAGSIVSSTGDVAEAERLFRQAKQLATNQADTARACFNLFQTLLRRKAYPEALAELQAAIAIDTDYALHDIEKYPIEGLLGAGGMGCVFLCHDEWRENKVVVKCFWAARKGRREEVFKEVLIMRNLKSGYVPKTLSYGYVNPHRQQKPYFVTEYIAGALDGEAWLAQHNKMDLATGLAVAIQIAQGLTVAHKAGVYHLDLKPANLLLKKTDKQLTVKIIDFGLARVAVSLKKQAAETTQRSNKSLLAQSIFGTLDYAPPEQQGETQYGQPGAKSDVFAFGATLYRLLSGESPRFPHPSELPDVPELQTLLLDCLKPNPEKRPNIEDVLTRLSSGSHAPAWEPSQDAPASTVIHDAGASGLHSHAGAWERESKAGDIFRDTLKDGSKAPEMVIIPAGKFRMGDIQGTGGNREKPVHEVSVKSFAMGRYPVTFEEYDKFAKATNKEKPNDSGWGRDNRPVINVSWHDAMAYVKWLSEQTGQQYSLPSESQWEYAARAGTDTDYWWGNEIGKNKANCRNSGSQWSGKQTSPVGSFEPNPFGLYDTVGNVREWIADSWHKDYTNAPNDDKIWAEGADKSYRVLRGGSWYDDPSLGRVADRNWGNPVNRDVSRGFRVVRCLAART